MVFNRLPTIPEIYSFFATALSLCFSLCLSHSISIYKYVAVVYYGHHSFTQTNKGTALWWIPRSCRTKLRPCCLIAYKDPRTLFILYMYIAVSPSKFLSLSFSLVTTVSLYLLIPYMCIYVSLSIFLSLFVPFFLDIYYSSLYICIYLYPSLAIYSSIYFYAYLPLAFYMPVSVFRFPFLICDVVNLLLFILSFCLRFLI